MFSQLFCTSFHVGDIFVVCLKKPVSFLVIKLRPAVPSPGNDSVTVPVNTRTEFALAPPREEDNEGDAGAIKSWEKVYQSVTELLDFRKQKSLPMPAVRPVHTVTLCALLIYTYERINEH